MNDIVRGNHRQGRKPRAILQIDIMKAYGFLNWDFLFMTMSLLNFPKKFVEWVYNGVTAARFSLNMNGALVDYFHSERGLGQGDPISPYLFIIAMEVFSMLFDWKVEQSGFDIHPRCKNLKLHHLAFADDLFLVTAATEKSFQVINTAIREFGELTGLIPNMVSAVCTLVGWMSRKLRNCA